MAENRWRKWSNNDIIIAQEMYLNDKSYSEIAKRLKRTKFGVSNMLNRYKMKTPQPRKFESSKLDKSEVHIYSLIEYIGRRFGYLPEEVLSKSRAGNIPICRQIAHLILYENSDLTLAKIGEKIGGIGHDSVIHSKKEIKRIMDIYPKVKEVYEDAKVFYIDFKKEDIAKKYNNDINLLIKDFKRKLINRSSILMFEIILNEISKKQTEEVS